MNDSRCLLQEFHTLVSEYSEKLPMTKLYRDSLIRRIEAELETTRPEVVTHLDHPLRHWDRTCPVCLAETVPTKAFIVGEHQHLRACLAELLRLYDWRNELGRIERDFNHDKKKMTTWLNQYGREKKQAWSVARELLTGGRKTQDFSAVSPPAKHVMPTGTKSYRCSICLAESNTWTDCTQEGCPHNGCSPA